MFKDLSLIFKQIKNVPPRNAGGHFADKRIPSDHSNKPI